MLEQALVNLLLNACDACKRRGHVVARVAIEGEGDRVAFTVLDDGAGITTENAARAAEPFFTTSRRATARASASRSPTRSSSCTAAAC